MDPKTRLVEGEKRKIPVPIQKLLAYDVQLTKRFVSFCLNFVAIRSLKTHFKFLEYSCHGIVWLAGLLAVCWFTNKPEWYQFQMNLFLGLILDIIFVAITKAATRRRRPTVNDDIFSIGPDKFSFPSGHASRAFFILSFFTMLDPVSYLFWPPIFAWATSVTLSRLLLYRHHILDVLAGILLGFLEAGLLGLLWLEKDTAFMLMNWLSEERLPGSATQEDTF